jgi:hypothetical protein
MFQGSQLEHYFLRAETSKSSSSSATPSSGHETSANLVSLGIIDGWSNGSPIVLGSSSESSIASTCNVKGYPLSDPRYIHPPRATEKRAYDTPHSVCNQPRKRRSNPAVQLITPERLSVPKNPYVINLLILTIQ